LIIKALYKKFLCKKTYQKGIVKYLSTDDKNLIYSKFFKSNLKLAEEYDEYFEKFIQYEYLRREDVST